MRILFELTQEASQNGTVPKGFYNLPWVDPGGKVGLWFGSLFYKGRPGRAKPFNIKIYVYIFICQASCSEWGKERNVESLENRFSLASHLLK